MNPHAGLPFSCVTLFSESICTFSACTRALSLVFKASSAAAAFFRAASASVAALSSLAAAACTVASSPWIILRHESRLPNQVGTPTRVN